jgi:hypothetical protein
MGQRGGPVATFLIMSLCFFSFFSDVLLCLSIPLAANCARGVKGVARVRGRNIHQHHDTTTTTATVDDAQHKSV